MSRATTTPSRWRANALALLLIVSGVVGFIASFILTIDKIAMLQDPAFVPACSINPLINCGSVMATAQAAVFGFANSLIGVAAFPALALLGLVLLAGAKLQRWFWLLIQAGVTLAVLFVHWLVFESLYRIGSLCPYCMAVWLVTIPTFWYVTLRNLQHGALAGLRMSSPWRSRLARHHAEILLLWFATIVLLVFLRFWYV